MKDKTNHPSHELFVDVVSFSNFFGNVSYIEHNKTLNELCMSNKSGYGTEEDSIVETSFKNILHVPYGNGSSGYYDLYVTAQGWLTGLPTLDKWDVHDGRSGWKYWIKDETRKAEAQLKFLILNQLNGSYQVPSCNLLHHSHKISHALYTFIITSYEDNMHSSKFVSTQAWKLTSSFVKQKFTEIGYARISARYDINIDAPL